jgi:AraC-like DNA-binding protein
MVSFGPPVEVTHSVNGVERTESFGACVAGLRDSAATVRYGAFRDAVYVNLKPMGIAALVGVAATELAGRTVALNDALGDRAAVLVERLSEVREWTARFAILEEFLRVLRPRRIASEIAWAWAQLQRTRGQAGVQALAEEIGWSRRHFAEQFREEIGLAPKTAARVLRFENACRIIKRERPALAQLAAECGFHDQAHLTREWGLLAGCTPREWMRRELPFFQDFDSGGRDNA